MEYNDLEFELEVSIAIFTAQNGKVKILLEHRNEDPYKGYWQLPNAVMDLEKKTSAEDEVYDTVFKKCGISSLYMEQTGTYTEFKRREEKRLITINFMGVINYSQVKYKTEKREDYETTWFDIEQLPKLAYAADKIINKTISKFRSQSKSLSILKKLYPSDFTLPELQKMFEHLLGINIDRRNFRKRFINHKIVEDTGLKNEGGSGRPAKLYSFSDEANITELF